MRHIGDRNDQAKTGFTSQPGRRWPVVRMCCSGGAVARIPFAPRYAIARIDRLSRIELKVDRFAVHRIIKIAGVLAVDRDELDIAQIHPPASVSRSNLSGQSGHMGLDR